MTDWFGASWGEIARVVSSTLAIYATVVIGLRIAGRRTVSQMSSFDFVVTIAIGSLVASTALSPEPSYGKGIAALLALLAAQQIVAVIRQRIPVTQRLLDFPPEHVYSNGKLNLRNHPLTAQVTEQELWSHLRSVGVRSLEEVTVVVLEPDGRISVLREDEPADLWQEPLRMSRPD